MPNKCCGKCDHLINDYCSLYLELLFPNENCNFVRCDDCISHKTFVTSIKKEIIEPLVLIDKPNNLKVIYDYNTGKYTIVIKNSSNIIIQGV